MEMQLRSRLLLATSQAQTARGYLKSSTDAHMARVQDYIVITDQGCQAQTTRLCSGGKNSNSCKVKNDERALSS